jgi:hypothetical protein
VDKSDIIQQKYESSNDIDSFTDPSMMYYTEEGNNGNNGNNGDNGDNSNSINEENIGINKSYDHLFSRVEDMKKVTLDNYVIKSNGTINPKILPKKEEINIKTKEHKRKGISKKKNIKNIYEDSKNEKK